MARFVFEVVKIDPALVNAPTPGANTSYYGYAVTVLDTETPEDVAYTIARTNSDFMAKRIVEALTALGDWT